MSQFDELGTYRNEARPNTHTQNISYFERCIWVRQDDFIIKENELLPMVDMT
jgi:hypothetical protein